MSTYPLIDRDISWLSFNYRVLQEAKDSRNPLFERIKFIAIYSNNLEEFFKVRVAHHRNLMRVGKKRSKELQLESRDILRRIITIVTGQQLEIQDIFNNQIIPELRLNGIFLKRRLDLNRDQLDFIEQFYRERLQPYVQPILLDGKRIKPFLNNASIYLAVHLRYLSGEKTKSRYAIVQIPTHKIDRFIELPPVRPGTYELIYLDDVIRHCIQFIFPGYEIVQSYSIKLTRDAELYIDDEYDGNLLEKIRDSLKKRKVGPASRLVYDKTIPEEFLNYLMDVFDLDKLDIVPEGRYHNNFDLFGFPNFGMESLCIKPLDPLPYPPLENTSSLFSAMEEKDHLIFVPYHSYESVIKFFEEAASDPDVTHIKIVQYRVARISRIMEALRKAVRAGKQVSAFIEVKARFDEEANIKWGEILERSGVKVHYSFSGIKVHAKLALIRKRVGEDFKHYAYLSTGNFHEGTAKVYSDFGFFTIDPRITDEVVRVFSFLETRIPPKESFRHLMVGKFNLRKKLSDLIAHEVRNAKRGDKAVITLKMNSLQEPNMITKLYEAGEAGVEVRLIIRGMCSIVPQMPGISDNISGISIVDRYLEHARVFWFHHSGKDLMFLSSADWMGRNLYRRVETVFPVYDEHIKKQLKEFMDIQFRDNMKARSLNYKRENDYIKQEDSVPFQSQIETYYYIKREMNKDEIQQG
jgi:polyphosphate kinase